MEGCGSSGMVSGATMLHALASGDIRNDVTERHYGSLSIPRKMTFHAPAYEAISFVCFWWRRDLWSTSWFPLSVFFDHTTGALCSISSWDIPPRTYVGRTLYHTCSIVHEPLRFMIYRLKATVMFGDAISTFDTRPLSYSEKPYQPSGKPELPKLKLKFHDSPDVWPS